MEWFLYILFWALLAFTHPLHAQELDFSELDELIVQAMATSQTPGLAVAVIDGEGIAYSKGFGVRDIGKSALVNKDTIFAIGSNSKYFTATAVGLLVHDGLLDWDEPLSRYLPGLRFSDPYLFTNLTLRDALSHRTGLARSSLAWYAYPGSSREEILAKIEFLPMEIGFRSGFLYNNFLYVAAGEAIASASGTSWDETIENRILDPLGMTRSSTSITSLARTTNIARPHTLVNGEVRSIPYYNVDHVAPAGSINSSISDMAQWCSVQINNGKLGNSQIIPETVIQELREPHTLVPLAESGNARTVHAAYALGIGRSNYGPNSTAYWHTGGIDGMLSRFSFVPEANLCVVTLVNIDPDYGLNELIHNWILDHYLGLPEKGYLKKYVQNVKHLNAYMTGLTNEHLMTADADSTPSLQLASYSGSYKSRLFGKISISHTDGQLYFQFGTLYSGTLKHHRGDSFDVVLDEVARSSEAIYLSFSIDANGDVESLLMEKDQNPIRFKRKSTE